MEMAEPDRFDYLRHFLRHPAAPHLFVVASHFLISTAKLNLLPRWFDSCSPNLSPLHQTSVRRPFITSVSDSEGAGRVEGFIRPTKHYLRTLILPQPIRRNWKAYPRLSVHTEQTFDERGKIVTPLHLPITRPTLISAKTRIRLKILDEFNVLPDRPTTLIHVGKMKGEREALRKG